MHRGASFALAASVAAASTWPDTISFSDVNRKEEEETSESIVMPFRSDLLKHDHYQGITLVLDDLEFDQTTCPEVFALHLKNALQIWKAEGKRGIWLEISKARSHLIPSCVDAGFDFHVASPNVVTMRTWLPNTPNRLPHGPTHQVGVGALVLHPHDSTKMLVVQERTGPAAARGLWKMPTGLVDPGEDVAQASIRELQEETGLSGSFDSVLCFRQAHTEQKPSDLFFVCKVSLKEDSDLSHKAQQEEIADIQWMSISEYTSQEVWQNSPLYKELNDSILKAASDGEQGFVEKKLPVGFRPGRNALYKSRM